MSLLYPDQGLGRGRQSRHLFCLPRNSLARTLGARFSCCSAWLQVDPRGPSLRSSLDASSAAPSMASASSKAHGQEVEVQPLQPLY